MVWILNDLNGLEVGYRNMKQVPLFHWEATDTDVVECPPSGSLFGTFSDRVWKNDLNTSIPPRCWLSKLFYSFLFYDISVGCFVFISLR